ncbi:MAG TPA: cupin domain-containing protein [Vicinamibacterales bacterium]
MFRFVAAVVMVFGAATTALAQDPTQTLPEAYKTEFENNYVKVVRVHYDAGAKLPEHTHPAGTTAYVYLNDSDGVVFAHVGGSNRAVTRPAVKAGAMRIAAGSEEHHSAENTSSTATDFLRIMFKTDNAGVNNLRQRIAPTEVDFANKQMRITRLRVKPGQTLAIETKSAPALRIAMREGVKQWTPLPPDMLRWLDKGTTEDFAVTGDFPVDIIKIEFLTKPK